MTLHTIKLWKKVNITPDYSIVHDWTPDEWLSRLNGDNGIPAVATRVWTGSVNYYRLPDVIRIEAPYDSIRQATYGSIEGARQGIVGRTEAYERPMFFWVKKVRLVKECAAITSVVGGTVEQDVVELEIAPDVWTNNQGKFELFDSFVERRHMNRWKEGSSPGTYDPLYYPSAEQGVEGARLVESVQKLLKESKLYWHQGQADEASITIYPRSFIVNVIDTNGQLDRLLFIDPAFVTPVYETYNTCRYLGLSDLLDGTLYTAIGLTADFVQSIVALPFDWLSGSLEYTDSGGTKYLHLKDTAFSSGLFAKHTSGGYAWVSITPNYGGSSETAVTLTPTAPDLTYLPGTDPTGAYDHDEHEPMMFRSPARIRKIVTGMGGEVLSIPDVNAFAVTLGMMLMNDISGAVILVRVQRSGSPSGVSAYLSPNVEGEMGVIECSTLPIYNSAWKSYEAINKIGDEIAYNAHQAAAVANGVAAGASGAIMGVAGTGSPLGAVLGVFTGGVSTAAGMYSTAEELRAKQVTIRNSPANVKSGGSGLAAYSEMNMPFPVYVTVKMDDQSMEKLRSSYYWYGYQVNRTFKGAIDLQVRRFFDYIKTDGARVRGDLNMDDASAIAAIFDKGVTIVHTHSDAANYGYISQNIAGELYNNDEYWLL